MPRPPADIPDATLRVLLAPGLGPVTLERLEARLGSHERIAGSVAGELREAGLGPAEARAVAAALAGARPNDERIAMAGAGVRMILRDDADYPALLRAIDHPPPALWIRGETTTADRLAIAVVGARRCTPYGREQAGRLSALLAGCGLTIVSGGALGIDGEAHRGALRAAGRTIAVMGCGLGRCYPPQHADLFERIVGDGGALLSALPMHAPPKAAHFPARNRVIAGLALGVLVVEAARRSGALITARLTAEALGREVMAVPGRVDSPASAGCLQAIREGWAGLVTSHAEILEQLDGASQLVRGALEAAGHADARSAATLFDGNLSAAQSSIIEALRAADGSLGIDRLAAGTGLGMSQLLAEITLLQVRGRLGRDGGAVVLRG